jgi:plastocyanin
LALGARQKQRATGEILRVRRKAAVSSMELAFFVLIIAVAAVSVVYIDSAQQIADLQSQLTSLNGKLSSIQSNVGTLQSNVAGFATRLPLMNQTPTVRAIRFTWYLSPQAHQDRFEPSFPVVNQGDTVQLTLIDNDTVAHDWVVGPPYSIVVNATVPGLINDLTGQTFTTPSRNNSPGVMINGTPGNVTVTYSFVAKYAGVYEFVCTYHAQVGMIGYMVVLPNAAYATKPPAGHPTTGTGVRVSIVNGAGTNISSRGFSPNTVTASVSANNTVTWVNDDSSPHTVTADDGSFNSGNIAPGQSFSYTFTTPGTYKYHCTYHPWMTATVVVKP